MIITLQRIFRATRLFRIFFNVTSHLLSYNEYLHRCVPRVRNTRDQYNSFLAFVRLPIHRTYYYNQKIVFFKKIIIYVPTRL